MSPTLPVSGISVEFNRLDDAAESWGIIVAMWVSALCVGFPAPLGVGEFGGVTAGRSIGVARGGLGGLAPPLELVQKKIQS